MASRSVNEVRLIGTLGRDAESKFTPGGVSVTKFSIATNRRWKDKQSDEWKEEVDWHNITLWRGEGVTQYLTKGKQVYVGGRLQTRSYDKDGVKVYATDVVADEVILLGGKGQGESGDREPVSAPRSSRPQAPVGEFPPGVGIDDVPF